MATLALGRLDTPDARASARDGVRWLVERQRDNGAWPVSARVNDDTWATALAVLVLDALARDHVAAVRGARWLLRRTPRRPGLAISVLHRLAPEALPVRMNPHLKGWPWTEHEAAFVEPTCYALLALKRLRPHLPGTAATERIEEAERMLYDRMCRDGGWNYGNSTVLAADLPPYADITALALLVLAEHAARDANRQSLRVLHTLLETVDSGLAVAWSALCLSAYGEHVAPLRERLLARYASGGFRGETKVLALALLALSDGVEAFRT